MINENMIEKKKRYNARRDRDNIKIHKRSVK